MYALIDFAAAPARRLWIKIECSGLVQSFRAYVNTPDLNVYNCLII